MSDALKDALKKTGEVRQLLWDAGEADGHFVVTLNTLEQDIRELIARRAAEAPEGARCGNCEGVQPETCAAHSPEPRWLQVARGEMGQKEVPGKAHNPRIVEYHAATSLKASADEVPWCSSFVNWCMQRAGVRGTGSAAAASWEKWGLPAPSRPGAVVVLYSAKAAGSMTVTGNHVGFLLEETPTHYRVLGGNQSDSVKVSEFSMAAWTLKACRWPSGGGK